MANKFLVLTQDPNLTRIDELLARPALFAEEAEELRHLAGLHGIRLQWSLLDLQTGEWKKEISR